MKILKKEILAKTKDTKIVKMEILSPDIAKNAKAGQFVVLMVSEKGERIPLTLVNTDKKKGIITLIFQELGFTTKLFSSLGEGDQLYAIVGPLGHATELKKYGKVVLVGGGVGIAEIYPVAKALKEIGNAIIAILGARTKKLLILENELKAESYELFSTTDDGSCGKKGFTTDILEEILKKDKFDLIYAVGPIPMMAKVSQIGKEHNVKTVVSLNALMVDGTGMCGCCRVTVNKKVKFSCVDGPEFDGQLVDWEEFTKRSKIYIKKEKHICKLNNTL